MRLAIQPAVVQVQAVGSQELTAQQEFSAMHCSVVRDFELHTLDTTPQSHWPTAFGSNDCSAMEAGQRAQRLSCRQQGAHVAEAVCYIGHSQQSMLCGNLGDGHCKQPIDQLAGSGRNPA